MDAKQWTRSVEPAAVLLPQAGGFRPCSHRTVTEDGRVVCAKISRGEREVSPALCAACPAARINCQHLRFTLEQDGPSTLVVRYGSGKTEVWADDRPPQVRFTRAACALLRLPLVNTTPCATCTCGQPITLAPTPLPLTLRDAGDRPQPPDSQASPESDNTVTPEGTEAEPRRRGEKAEGQHLGRLIPFPTRLTRCEVRHESPD